MPSFDQILHEVTGLSPLEKEQLLVALSKEVRPSQEYSTIVSTPGVCGGSARIIRTRIPVWTLENMRRLGISEADILKSFPSLQAADLVQAWAYVARNRDEIEKDILENDEA